MAIATYTSGNFNTTNQYIKFNVVVDLVSQDTSNNTSVVNVRVNVWRTNTGYTTYGTGTLYTNIDGVQRNIGITPSQKITNNAICLFNQNISVGHNNDGAKTLIIGLSISHNQFNSSPTNVEFKCNLKTIPRASSFTLSSSDVVAGASITGNISRASASFKHDVFLGFGTKSWKLASNVDTSFSATIPMETLNQIPNAIKGQGNIRVVTKNGNSEVGQNAINFYISTPSSVTPTFSSLSLTRVDNTVPSSWGVYVKGKSKVTATINGAVGSYGSSITNYSIKGDIYSSTESRFTTDILTLSGTVAFNAAVTDSRGRTHSKTVNITVVDYESPKILDFVVQRCTSNGTLNDEGTYVKVVPKWSYSTVNNKNTFTAKIDYKAVSSTAWSSATTVSTSGSSYILGSNTISVNSTYEIRLTIKDSFETITKIVTIPTASTPLDFRNGGKGIAIGKVAERDGFEVAWDSNFLKALKVNGNDVYHVGKKPTKSDVGLSNVNNWSASSDIAANSTSQYATTNMVAKVRNESVKFDHSGDTSGNHHPRIYVPGKEWLRAPSGGFVPYSHGKGYLGLSDKSWYDFYTQHINSKPIGGFAGRWWNIMTTVGGDGVTEIGKYIDFHKSSSDTSDYTVRLDATGSNLWCSTTIAQASDRNLKENIVYLDDEVMAISSKETSQTKFKDFIKDFKFATYNYKGSDGRSFGFIAQDIIEDEVAKYFIAEVSREIVNKETNDIEGVENSLCFGLADYTSVIAKALQEEIIEKDEKIKSLELRLEKIEKLLELTN